jgi:hypothetical protein
LSAELLYGGPVTASVSLLDILASKQNILLIHQASLLFFHHGFFALLSRRIKEALYDSGQLKQVQKTTEVK